MMIAKKKTIVAVSWLAAPAAIAAIAVLVVGYGDRIFGGYLDVRFRDNVTLSGMHYGWFGRQCFGDVRIDRGGSATGQRSAAQPAICVGDEMFALPDLTPKRLIDLGASRHPHEPDVWLHEVLDPQGSFCRSLEFTFSNGALQHVYASTVPCDNAPTLYLCRADSGERLALPCSGTEARAFLGEPVSTHKWRGR